MVMRLLHGCGLYLGPKDALMPPQADNPDGFWEHLGFVALNDELLEALGGDHEVSISFSSGVRNRAVTRAPSSHVSSCFRSCSTRVADMPSSFTA